MFQEYFRILGLPVNASLNEIKKAYRNKAKLCHPDVNHSADAHEQFIRINEAYELLLKHKQGQYSFTSQQTKSNSYNHCSYEDISRDLIRREQVKARQRAAQHARMQYEEFKKSKIYKSAKILNKAIDVIYLIVAVCIIVIPVVFTSFGELRPDQIVPTIVAMFFSMLFGGIMIMMIIADHKRSD